MDDSGTPLMKQYWDLKAQVGDALLLFRMGDFYELFGDDAVTAARILEITLTSRDRNKPNPVPMAGVPHHSVQSYLQRLLKAGRKVAIGEQMEDPAALKGKALVRREITRVFTPAVQFDAEGSENAFLATAVVSAPGGDTWVLACLDPSTGEALVSEPLGESALAAELGGLSVRHFLRVGHALPEEAVGLLGAIPSTLLEDLPSNYLSPEQAARVLMAHYGVECLAAFVATDAAAHALGILVTYAARTQMQERLAHLRVPSPLRKPRTMTLGPRTAQHLDLLPSADGAPNLYQLINRTRSALGARQLRRWLAEPLLLPAEIATRQATVRELSAAPLLREKTSSDLAALYDLERICGRLNARLAGPRDTLALGRSASTLPRLAAALGACQTPLAADMRTSLLRAAERLQPLAERILRSQREDAPLVSRDGGIFNPGTSPELDRLLSLTEDGQRWLVDLEARERSATAIPSLKVRYNRVFGYYIEVTQAHLRSVPPHYQRKQTMVGAERFFTEELKKFEEEILTASSKQKALELELFEELTRDLQAETPAIMEAARVLGELDSLLALAALADAPGWVFPEIDDSLEIAIDGGRHPLVDAAARGAFVPNPLRLSPETRRTLLITGPNMGGKSTYMRQVALIVILGQAGAPIPAASARWGAVSSLYTRIGAHDAIARGQSTFMVEMTELAHILHRADERSLLVLDEIGRGTSTYDGISVAWAALEWICLRIQARTLFATHYHELTRLAASLPNLQNAHLAVSAERGEDSSDRLPRSLRFLYELREGPTAESFGIHVARIAGLPTPVIERAWQVLGELEGGGAAPSVADGPGAAEAALARRPALRTRLTAAEPAATVDQLSLL